MTQTAVQSGQLLAQDGCLIFILQVIIPGLRCHSVLVDQNLDAVLGAQFLGKQGTGGKSLVIRFFPGVVGGGVEGRIPDGGSGDIPAVKRRTVLGIQKPQEIPGITGKFDLGVQNETGQRQTEFCQENVLVIANTLCQQNKKRLHMNIIRWSIPKSD